MKDFVLVILWIICSWAIWVIYHKLFNVMYFNLLQSCLKEFIVAGFFGGIMVAFIIRFWPVVVIIAALLLFAFSKKT